MKKIIIRSGNISIGGQEKMLMEFLKALDPQKYDVLLLIEEDNREKNDYEKDIPAWINYKFLVSGEFMDKIKKNKGVKNPIRKAIYSYLLKKKKKIAIKNFADYLEFSDVIIDYDMGLLRNVDQLNLEGKTLVGWSHAGEGKKLKNQKKQDNLELYDYVVSINDEMKKGYEENTTHPKNLRIYNFMDLDEIISRSSEPMEEDFGDYILSIGSLTENKNQKLLINAFANLKRDNKISGNLVILGKGREKEKLETRVKELGLEDSIFLLGQKANPYKYLKNCTLYVTTSIGEGFSLTTLEAMTLGKMAISTKTNGTSEILGVTSEYGKIVENNNLKELEKALEFYLNNEAARNEYEEKGLKRAKKFSKEEIKEEIEEFIDKL